MADQTQLVADAFSHKAAVYDAFGEDHPGLARMRAKVRAHLLSLLQPGDQILELNAGTGSDAAFLAEQGYRVHATDLAPGMVAAIEEKIRDRSLAPLLTAQQLSFTELDQLPPGSYQHLFSNMGGLNCSADLRQVSGQLPRLLAPGATVTWVIMPPVCLWELAMVFCGDLPSAVRRLRPGGTLAHVEGVHFLSYYYTPRQVIESFGPDFRPVALRGLSVLTPPADRKGFARRFPHFFSMLVRLDDQLADRWPFRSWGDFFILSMRYLPT